MTRRTLACAGVMIALAAAAQAAPVAQAASTEAAAAARADWSAGPVGRWTGYASARGSHRVREVQRRLSRLGYSPGPVDGLFGARTEQAAQRFQQRNGLRADAIVGPATLRVLRARDDARRAGRTQASEAPASAPASPPEPVLPASAPAPVVPPTEARPPAVLVALLALAAAGLGAIALRARHRRRPVSVRGDEIVAASATRELTAVSEAGSPPRWSRSGPTKELDPPAVQAGEVDRG